ncbi:MAG: A/G-specific adenine glycosylase [Opitutales bacterium]
MPFPPTPRLLPIPAAELQNSLLAWYDAHARDLPWRREPSLYRTVVSEIMLQQTQVSTVLPYFERWMAVFPDFKTLANASEDSVLKQWEGLGYYRRARNLHALAKVWTALSAAERPVTAADWLTMPGIGPYTAAAVASIALGDATAVVDGNVVRVLSRLVAERREFASSSAAVAAVRPIADALMAGCSRPGDLNQAVMELGAVVCRKGEPACLLCPWRQSCHARADGDAADLPRLKRAKSVARTVDRLLLQDAEERLLLRQVPEDSARLAGLWEIPEVAEVVAAGLLSLQEVSGAAQSFVQKRGIANERITEVFFVLKVTEPRASPSGWSWTDTRAQIDLALNGPHRKALTRLTEVPLPMSLGACLD